MFDIGEIIFDLFGGLGTFGLLLCLFLILYIDAVLFPTLPELFAIIIFGALVGIHGWDNISLIIEWGAICLVIIVVAEILGVSTLYFIVRKLNVPEWIKSKVEAYMSIMIIGDEKAILANRVAPIIPFMGAFIAIMKWDYNKSMIYLAIGGVVKYIVVLALAGSLYALFAEGTAQTLALVLALLIVGVSILISMAKKKRMEKIEVKSQNGKKHKNSDKKQSKKDPIEEDGQQ